MATRAPIDVAKLARAVIDELAPEISELMRARPRLGELCHDAKYDCTNPSGYTCAATTHTCTGVFTCNGAAFIMQFWSRRPG